MIEHAINAIKTDDTEPSIYDKLIYRFYDSWIFRIYQYSWLYNLRWKITHWWYKDHWVHCNLPCTYHDKPELMQSALFTLVEDYIAKDREDALSIVVTDEDVMEKIIQILHFYRIESIELQDKIDKLTNDLYGKTDLFFGDVVFPENNNIRVRHVMDNCGRVTVDFVDHSGHTEEEKKAMTQELRQLEQELFDKTQEHLKLCIDVRPHLWS